MFSRNNETRSSVSEAPPTPQPEPAAQRRTTPRPASVLASDLVFEGHIRGKGELQIDGVFSGDIEARRLLVAHSARIEGTIRCEVVEIRGRVKGDIRANVVKIYETAHVEGDVLHRQLSVDAGAVFEGRSQRMAPEPEAASPPSPHLLEGPPVLETAAAEPVD